MTYLILTGLGLVVLARPAIAVYRFARLPRQGKRNWLPARWARLRWRWLAHNLGLAYVDRHRKAVRRPHLPSTSVKVQPVSPEAPARLRFPRARFRADEFGIVARVRTVPGVDRLVFEDRAPHIANSWKCVRVQVHQDRPGRLTIRGLRRDPLTVPYPMAEVPPGVYGPAENSAPGYSQEYLTRRIPRLLRKIPHPGIPANNPLRLYLGRDEWSAHRWFPLRGTAGITVGGLPDYGKTTLVLSWLAQLAALDCVQFVFIDGKGGADYADWQDRAWIFTGDDLPAASAALEDVHGLMRSRLADVARPGQVRNRWRIGPTPEWPLIVTVLDECHSFLSDQGRGAPPEVTRPVSTCRAMTSELIRKGRSVLFLTVLITQKQTGDAIPTMIRDNCRLGVSFAVRTRDAAVAALGDHIREYPSVCPTGLLDPAYVGVCTAALPTAHNPFVRLRSPEYTEDAAGERARATASLRADPTQVHQPQPENAPVRALRAV